MYMHNQYIMLVNVTFLTHSFIYSGHFYSAPSSPLLLRGASRLQHGYCIGVSRRSAQATAGKGLDVAESHRLNQGATTSLTYYD